MTSSHIYSYHPYHRTSSNKAGTAPTVPSPLNPFLTSTSTGPAKRTPSVTNRARPPRTSSSKVASINPHTVPTSIDPSMFQITGGFNNPTLVWDDHDYHLPPEMNPYIWDMGKEYTVVSWSTWEAPQYSSGELITPLDEIHIPAPDFSDLADSQDLLPMQAPAHYPGLPHPTPPHDPLTRNASSICHMDSWVDDSSPATPCPSTPASQGAIVVDHSTVQGTVDAAHAVTETTTSLTSDNIAPPLTFTDIPPASPPTAPHITTSDSVPTSALTVATAPSLLVSVQDHCTPPPSPEPAAHKTPPVPTVPPSNHPSLLTHEERRSAINGKPTFNQASQVEDTDTEDVVRRISRRQPVFIRPTPAATNAAIIPSKAISTIPHITELKATAYVLSLTETEVSTVSIHSSAYSVQSSQDQATDGSTTSTTSNSTGTGSAFSAASILVAGESVGSRMHGTPAKKRAASEEEDRHTTPLHATPKRRVQSEQPTPSPRTRVPDPSQAIPPVPVHHPRASSSPQHSHFGEPTGDDTDRVFSGAEDVFRSGLAGRYPRSRTSAIRGKEDSATGLDALARVAAASSEMEIPQTISVEVDSEVEAGASGVDEDGVESGVSVRDDNKAAAMDLDDKTAVMKAIAAEEQALAASKEPVVIPSSPVARHPHSSPSSHFYKKSTVPLRGRMDISVNMAAGRKGNADAGSARPQTPKKPAPGVFIAPKKKQVVKKQHLVDGRVKPSAIWPEDGVERPFLNALPQLAWSQREVDGFTPRFHPTSNAFMARGAILSPGDDLRGTEDDQDIPTTCPSHILQSRSTETIDPNDTSLSTLALSNSNSAASASTAATLSTPPSKIAPIPAPSVRKTSARKQLLEEQPVIWCAKRPPVYRDHSDDESCDKQEDPFPLPKKARISRAKTSGPASSLPLRARQSHNENDAYSHAQTHPNAPDAKSSSKLRSPTPDPINSLTFPAKGTGLSETMGTRSWSRNDRNKSDSSSNGGSTSANAAVVKTSETTTKALTRAATSATKASAERHKVGSNGRASWIPYSEEEEALILRVAGDDKNDRSLHEAIQVELKRAQMTVRSIGAIKSKLTAMRKETGTGTEA